MKTIRSILIPALILGLLPLATQACEGLQVHNPWIREAPPGAPAMAGYAELVNTGSKPLQLSAVRSVDFARAEVHESRMVDGQMRMRRLDPITLAPGQHLSLKPSADHLMLMAPAASFGGRSSVIEWLCGSKTLRTVFPVRRAN